VNDTPVSNVHSRCIMRSEESPRRKAARATTGGLLESDRGGSECQGSLRRPRRIDLDNRETKKRARGKGLAILDRDVS